MSGEYHIKSVISHLEALSEEALDLGESRWWEDLERAHGELCGLLKKSAVVEEKKNMSLKELQKFEQRLLAFLGDQTMELAFDLKAQDYALLLTGRQLSVANRIRYRSRQLQKIRNTYERAEKHAKAHEELIRLYDAQVDHFLENSARAAYLRQEALWESQRLRPLLQKAKKTLLERSEKGSEQFKRIKKRVVMTKKAHWMHEMPSRGRLMP